MTHVWYWRERGLLWTVLMLTSTAFYLTCTTFGESKAVCFSVVPSSTIVGFQPLQGTHGTMVRWKTGQPHRQASLLLLSSRRSCSQVLRSAQDALEVKFSTQKTRFQIIFFFPLRTCPGIQVIQSTLRKFLHLVINSKLKLNWTTAVKNLRVFKLFLNMRDNRHKICQHHSTDKAGYSACQCPPEQHGRKFWELIQYHGLQADIAHPCGKVAILGYLCIHRRYPHPMILEILILKPLREDWTYLAVTQIRNWSIWTSMHFLRLHPTARKTLLIQIKS